MSARPSAAGVLTRAGLREAGPGHYVVDTLQLVPAGSWRLHVAARVSEFDRCEATLKVQVG